MRSGSLHRLQSIDPVIAWKNQERRRSALRGWARIPVTRDTGESTIPGMTTTNRSYKSGQSRKQAGFLPARLEDYIGRDNPVRAIDAYVDSLHLNELGFRDVGSVQRVYQLEPGACDNKLRHYHSRRNRVLPHQRA